MKANSLNDFFINKGPTLSSKIKPDPEVSYKKFSKNKTNHVFTFQTNGRTSILKTINDLPHKASCGLDIFSLKLIKSNKFNILFSLISIINPLSLRDALNHYLTFLKTNLISLQPRVFERKFP